jgi:hypothetical protein
MSIISTVLFKVADAMNSAAKAISTYVVVPTLRKANATKAKAHDSKIRAIVNSIKREEQWQATLQQDLSRSYSELFAKRRAMRNAVEAETDFFNSRIV